MKTLSCLAHVALPSSGVTLNDWTRVIDGTQVEPIRIETMLICNETAGAINAAIAVVLAGESVDAGTGIPPNKCFIFYRESVSAKTTEQKEADLGLMPGDRLYAWASAVGITITIMGKI